MVDSSVDLRVRVSCALGTELPYAPVGAMFTVEEIDKLLQWCPVCKFGVVCRGARGCNDCRSRNKVSLQDKPAREVSNSVGQGKRWGLAHYCLRHSKDLDLSLDVEVAVQLQAVVKLRPALVESQVCKSVWALRCIDEWGGLHTMNCNGSV